MQCKSCKSDFNESTILKHIIHKKSCNIAYSEKEINVYRQWSKERHKINKRSRQKKLYVPAQRRQKYLKNKDAIAKYYQENKDSIVKYYQENKDSIAKQYQENKGSIAERYHERVILSI